MNRGERKTKIESLLALLLFGVFALCILMVLLTGADIYNGLTGRENARYGGRTAAQYLTTRMRQADILESVRVERFGGVDALVTTEIIEGEPYETRVYCYDGYLRELFAAAGSEFAPEDGDKVLEAGGLTLAWEAGVLQAEILASDGTAQRLTLYQRSGEEVVT